MQTVENPVRISYRSKKTNKQRKIAKDDENGDHVGGDGDGDDENDHDAKELKKNP